MPIHGPVPRAVVFTHFGNLVFERKDAGKTIPFRNLRDGYIERYSEVFQSYMECNRKKNLISIVYAYVDWAVRKSLPLEKTVDAAGQPTFKYEPKLRGDEKELIRVLREAKRRAETRVSTGRNRIPSDNLPQFRYIGFDDLLGLLSNLIQAGEPNLTSFLCGKGQRFTYDSPKFVEAVIRLARGRIPHLAIDPIIRFDEDVEPNAKSIQILLQEYRETEYDHPFYFFSGTYGDPDGSDDPINDHAVRTHWFFPVGTKRLKLNLRDENLLELISTDDLSSGGTPAKKLGSLRLPRTQTRQENVELIKAIRLAYHFLADLSYLGATEVNNSRKFYSKTVRELTKSKGVAERGERQVISGAGLIMSNLAVDLLPPFMNFANQTVWVDDHIKRRLHEALQDIGETHKERVRDARSRQDRHPGGIKDSDMEFARKVYFERLLRGCLLHRTVIDLEGTATEYSKLVEDIVAYRMTRNDPKLSKRSLGSLKKGLLRQLENHCELVLRCWSSTEFEGTESFTWAKRLLEAEVLNLQKEEEVECYGWVKERLKDKPPKIRNAQLRMDVVRRWLYESVAQDAMDYITLVRNWPIFTRAIARLLSDWWLFR